MKIAQEKSVIVCDPLRDRVCYVFANLPDEYEHQYVISFFELSYNEPTLVLYTKCNICRKLQAFHTGT